MHILSIKYTLYPGSSRTDCPQDLVCLHWNTEFSLRANRAWVVSWLIYPAAHLRRNVENEIVAHSNYDSLNRTIQDEAWNHPDLEPWNLFLALDDDYAALEGLPHSQRWPWNPHKGAYIPIGAHELHCVVSKKIVRVFFPSPLFMLIGLCPLVSAFSGLQSTKCTTAYWCPLRLGRTRMLYIV